MKGTAEIVADLKELCEERGPRIRTLDVVRRLERLGAYESTAELVAFAKKMKARNYARMLLYEDPDSGLRIKRLWSFRDRKGDRYYHDVAAMTPDRRRRLVEQYARFSNQLRSVRRALNDYIAGQGFFEFYSDEDDDEAAAIAAEPPLRTARAAASLDRRRQSPGQ